MSASLASLDQEGNNRVRRGGCEREGVCELADELTGQEGDLALAVLFRRDLSSEHGGSRCHVDREAALGV